MGFTRRLITLCLVLSLASCNSAVESKAPAATGGVASTDFFGGTEPITNAVRAAIALIYPALLRLDGGTQLALLPSAVSQGYPLPTPFNVSDACLREARVEAARLILLDILGDLTETFAKPIDIDYKSPLVDSEGKTATLNASLQKITIDPTRWPSVGRTLLEIVVAVLHEGVHMIPNAYLGGRLTDGALSESLVVTVPQCNGVANLPVVAFDAQSPTSALELIEGIANLVAAWMLRSGYFDSATSGLTSPALTFAPVFQNLGHLTATANATSIQIPVLVRNLGQLPALDLQLTLSGLPQPRRVMNWMQSGERANGSETSANFSKRRDSFVSSDTTPRTDASPVMSVAQNTCTEIAAGGSCPVSLILNVSALAPLLTSGVTSHFGVSFTATYGTSAAGGPGSTSNATVIFSAQKP